MLVRATDVAQIPTRGVGIVRPGRAQSRSVGFQRTHTPSSIEWPTLLVAAANWGGWAAMLVWHDALPWPLVLLGFALLAGWYMSLQHEVIHGHPTPWRGVNTALAVMPTSLWLPFPLYRETHLDHHEAELTAPGVDPESFYVTPEQWDRASAAKRVLLRANRTFLGRVLIGPMIGPPSLVWNELKRARGNSSLMAMWAVHVAAAASVGWVVFGVAGVPVWQYLLGYTYLGMSVTYIRSFVEHLAVPAPATRSAVVSSGRFFGLLFLNNNLHHTHHALPGAAWYRLPRLTREMRASEIAAAGAGYYRGYLDVLRRYAVRPFSQPIDPLADRVSS